MESQTRTTVGLDRGLFNKLKEIAERQKCKVDDLVEESVKSKYRLYNQEDRLEAVEEMAAMELPVGDWEEMEREIVKGATES